MSGIAETVTLKSTSSLRKAFRTIIEFKNMYRNIIEQLAFFGCKE
jgi:hypothetical protein